MVGNKIRKISRGYRYFFVKPRQNSDANKIAEMLMRIENVRDVSVTEGEYGFVVRASGATDDATVRGGIGNKIAVLPEAAGFIGSHFFLAIAAFTSSRAFGASSQPSSLAHFPGSMLL